IGLYRSQPQQVAELLLKSDDEPLTDSYHTGCGHARHFFRRKPCYRPPNIRLTGDVHARVGTQERKQFCITAKIPAKASAGRYRSNLQISVVGAGSQSATLVPLEIQVLPIRLLDPQQDLFLWYKGTLDCRHWQHYVTPQLMRAQLRDILDHGFTSISLVE